MSFVLSVQGRGRRRGLGYMHFEVESLSLQFSWEKRLCHFTRISLQDTLVSRQRSAV